MSYCKRCGLEINSYISTYPYCPSCQPRLTVGLRETEQPQKTISNKYNNHSDLPWESGKDGGSIISKDEKLIESQNKSSISQNGYDCREYYGGAVVCETIGKSDQEFILHATKCFYDNVEVKILRIIQEISRKDELLSCVENKIAIQMLEASLYWLNERTRKRKEQQVEGTNKPHHS